MNRPSSDIDEAFIAEITEAQPLLRSYIWKMVGDRHAMKEVLQNANLVIWRKRLDWDPTTPFLKWAYRIAYFQTKAWLRDRKRDRLQFSPETLDLLAKDDRQQTQRQELLFEALEACLERLDSDSRELLLKRYQGSHSVEELAAVHNRSPNGLSQLMRRLRLKLSDCIESKISQPA